MSDQGQADQQAEQQAEQAQDPVDPRMQVLANQAAEIAKLRNDKAQLEEANAQLSMRELQVSKEVDFDQLSFADKSKAAPRPPTFNSQTKGTAVTHITREYGWFSKVGLKPEQWVGWFMDNLSNLDYQKVKDQLQQHQETAATVSHDKFRQLFLSLYGELDPDSTNFRKYIAVRQGNRSLQTYCQDYQNAVARLTPEVSLSEFVRCFFFLEHMDKTAAERLAVNPSTLGTWKSYPELLQAARALGSATRHAESSAPAQSTGKSGQKRARDSQGASAPPSKKGGNKAKIAETPTRSEAEQRYLRAKGLCFHCLVKADHLARKCDQKIQGIPAKNMPAEFKADEWQAGSSSKE